MTDHSATRMRDFVSGKAGYERALLPSGCVPVVDRTPAMAGTDPGHAGRGAGRTPALRVDTGSGGRTGVHVALSGGSRAQVDAFDAAALASGGRDHGPPGLQPQPHAYYAGAIVFDPGCHTFKVDGIAPEEHR